MHDPVKAVVQLLISDQFLLRPCFVPFLVKLAMGKAHSITHLMDNATVFGALKPLNTSGRESANKEYVGRLISRTSLRTKTRNEELHDGLNNRVLWQWDSCATGMRDSVKEIRADRTPREYLEWYLKGLFFFAIIATVVHVSFSTNRASHQGGPRLSSPVGIFFPPRPPSGAPVAPLRYLF